MLVSDKGLSAGSHWLWYQMDVGLDGWCKGNGMRRPIEKVEKENEMIWPTGHGKLNMHAY